MCAYTSRYEVHFTLRSSIFAIIAGNKPCRCEGAGVIWLDATSVQPPCAHKHLIGFINIVANSIAISSQKTPSWSLVWVTNTHSLGGSNGSRRWYRRMFSKCSGASPLPICSHIPEISNACLPSSRVCKGSHGFVPTLCPCSDPHQTLAKKKYLPH